MWCAWPSSRRPIGVEESCLLAVLVLTLAAGLPINRRLLQRKPEEHVARADGALARWGRLHLIRTVIAVVGTAALWL